jgi:predicted RNase H-like nuclease (RuvC/YqgF family)
VHIPHIEPEVQVAIVSGIFLVISTYLGRLVNKQNKTLRRVEHQVQNSHETNLRDDIDKIAHGVEKLSEGVEYLKSASVRHDAEIAGLRLEMRAAREDLRVEREERLAFQRLVS